MITRIIVPILAETCLGNLQTDTFKVFTQAREIINKNSESMQSTGIMSFATSPNSFRFYDFNVTNNRGNYNRVVSNVLLI